MSTGGHMKTYMWRPGKDEPAPEPPRNEVEAMFTPRRSSGWETRVLKKAWSDFQWGLNDLNECVNFYFSVERASVRCTACDQSGQNPATKRIADEFYAHSSPTGKGWDDAITDDEVDALWEHERLKHDFKEKPSAAAVNARQRGRGMGHDGINRWILIETRAKRLGVYGTCESCGGEGNIFTEPAAYVSLTLWMLHPRKGASRGVEIGGILCHPR